MLLPMQNTELLYATSYSTTGCSTAPNISTIQPIILRAFRRESNKNLAYVSYFTPLGHNNLGAPVRV